MNFKNSNVAMTPEILKRKLGGELLVPVTVATSAFTDGICKAGTPIDENGAKTTTAPVGILLNDVYAENPNGSLIKAYATVNATVAAAWSGVEYSETIKSALPLITFE